MSEVLIPKLRFPQFDDSWSTQSLGDISEEIKRKKENITSEDNILTISANKGFISQKERWDNVIAGSSLKKYTYLKQDEFSYNRGNSKAFKFGCIYKLNNYKNALVPNVYHSFKITSGKTDFFEQLFKSKILDKQLIKMITSTARMDGLLNISAKNFFSININFPNDLKEQEKIGLFLKAIDTKIALLEQKHDSYSNFKKYLMQQIFTQKLRFDNFDNEWEFKKLGQVSIVKDGTHDSPKYVPEGYPLITSKNLLNGEIDFENVNYISKEDYDNINKRSNVDKGDILFGMIGTIGNPLIVETDDFAIKNVALIKEKEELINQFLIYVLETDFINRQFYRLNAGGTQKFIALGLIKDLLVPIPSIEEQLKISKFLSTVDINLNSYKKEISNIKKFKNGLLQQMFI